MICALEVGSLIIGIIMLATGKVKLTRNQVRRGPAVRVAGAILIMPLPLAFAIGFGYGFFLGMHGRQFTQDQKLTMSLMEAAVTLICVILACIITFACTDARPVRRKRYDDDMDWDDEPPRRRRSRRHEDGDDEEDDDRFVRGSRDREEEEEEDRPRRRRRRPADEDYS